MKTSHIKQEAGYTLLEMITATVVFGVLGVIVIGVIAKQTESFNQVLNQTVGLADSRKAIQVFRRDIHNLSVVNISKMDNDYLKFVDNDGENISYQLTGSNLIRNGAVLLNGITADPFRYLDIDQEITGVKGSVKFIGIVLNVNRNNESIAMEEIVYARN